MNKIKNIIITITLLMLISCQKQESLIDKTVVPNLNIYRYLGKWYEIARYENSFEKGLVGVTATYSYMSSGKIKILNQGYEDSLSGPLKQAVGKAKIPDPLQPGKMKVSFFMFFYSDYLILEVDPNYQWAIVGGSSDDNLWILSRTPNMKKELYNSLLDLIKNRGYDTKKLLQISHKPLR